MLATCDRCISSSRSRPACSTIMAWPSPPSTWRPASACPNPPTSTGRSRSTAISSGGRWSPPTDKRPSRRGELLLALSVERIELFRQLDVHRRDILLEMGDLRGARNGKHDRRALEHPRERDL